MWKKSPVFVLFAALAVILQACGTNSPTEPTPPACTYTLSPTSLSIGASGGSGSVNVTTASHCTWTATSDRGWMTITSGSNGTGNGAVTVNLTANPAEAARTGTLTIAGQTVPVQEEGREACTIAISPSRASFNESSGTGSFTVTAPAHCEWSATSNSGWLRVTAGSPGTGTGSVAYSVERNRDDRSRTGTIAIGGQTFTVTQSADSRPPTLCEYSVTPVEFTPCMSAPYNLTATLTTQQGCTWTASPSASWISVTAGRSGSGPGTITFRVSDNWDAPRHGVVMVRWPTVTAGQNLQVAQAGCYYAVSTSAISIAAGGGTGQFNVIQYADPNTCGGPTQDACRWTAQSDVSWIRVTTAMPQQGDNPVSFTVTANSSATARTGTIRVRDKVVQITQSGQ